MFIKRANIDEHKSFTVSPQTVAEQICKLAITIGNVGFLFLECHHHVSWLRRDGISCYGNEVRD